jgi:hypothetical protein
VIALFVSISGFGLFVIAEIFLVAHLYLTGSGSAELRCEFGGCSTLIYAFVLASGSVLVLWESSIHPPEEGCAGSEHQLAGICGCRNRA